ncbi:hypothetical protein ACJX0J_038316, partial [Zea mays]
VIWVLNKSKTFTTQKDIYINIWNDRCALCQKQETSSLAALLCSSQIMLEKKVEEVHIRKTIL